MLFKNMFSTWTMFDDNDHLLYTLFKVWTSKRDVQTLTILWIWTISLNLKENIKSTHCLVDRAHQCSLIERHPKNVRWSQYKLFPVCVLQCARGSRFNQPFLLVRLNTVERSVADLKANLSPAVEELKEAVEDFRRRLQEAETTFWFGKGDRNRRTSPADPDESAGGQLAVPSKASLSFSSLFLYCRQFYRLASLLANGHHDWVEFMISVPCYPSVKTGRTQMKAIQRVLHFWTKPSCDKLVFYS